MSGETRAAAHGRWRDILPQLGVDPKFLVNKHGPCPICGGRDRFRFDDKGGHGGYYCNQCDPGDGITLLRKLHNWSYREACDEADRVLGHLPQRPVTPVMSQPHSSETDRETQQKLERVLGEPNDRRIVERYLIERGLSCKPAVLIGKPSLGYFTADRQFVGSFPAMVAPVHDGSGELRNAHRTYLAEVPEGRKKITLKMVGESLAVRLFPCAEVLGIGEGIETAVAAHEMFRMPVWAAMTAGNLKKWHPPAGVQCVHIFADNDAHKRFAGQQAAFDLASRISADLQVEVHVPPGKGDDWLDVLNAQRAT